MIYLRKFYVIIITYLKLQFPFGTMPLTLFQWLQHTEWKEEHLEFSTLFCSNCEEIKIALNLYRVIIFYTQFYLNTSMKKWILAEYVSAILVVDIFELINLSTAIKLRFKSTQHAFSHENIPVQNVRTKQKDEPQNTMVTIWKIKPM